MYTVKAHLPHLSKPKMYGFTNPADALRIADKFQAAGIKHSLGYQKSINLDEQLWTAAPQG